MKEHPILFTPENAQKIYRDLKRQTRRIAKFPSWVTEIEHVGEWWHGKGDHPARDCENEKCGHSYGPSMFTLKCPFGVPGDRLWVKESFKRDPHNDCMVFYKDGTAIEHNRGHHLQEEYNYSKQMSGMFMPRWASRSILEITDVRVERVQDISEEDAKAEGVTGEMIMNAVTQSPNPLPDSSWVGGFRWLWDSINAKSHPWSSNPLVWAITFRRI